MEQRISYQATFKRNKGLMQGSTGILADSLEELHQMIRDAKIRDPELNKFTYKIEKIKRVN